MPSNDASPDRKRCRAIGCQKRIPRNTLFCGVHFPLLRGTRFEAAVAENREPAGTDTAAQRRIVTGAADAVGHIAKIEGRKAEEGEARRARQASQDSTGANPAPGSGGGGGGSGGIGGSVKLK